MLSGIRDYQTVRKDDRHLEDGGYPRITCPLFYGRLARAGLMRLDLRSGGLIMSEQR